MADPTPENPGLLPSLRSIDRAEAPGFLEDVVMGSSWNGQVVRDRGSIGMRRCNRCSGVFNDVGMTPACPYCGSADTIETVASFGVSAEHMYRAVDAMEPGRFMDACVARELFMVRVMETPDEFKRMYPNWGDERLENRGYREGIYPVCVGIETPDGNAVYPHPLRHYSTREVDAWRVVSMMVAHSKDLTMRREGRMYVIGFCDQGEIGRFRETNAPEAVCKAALFYMRTHDREAPVPPEEEKFGVEGL